MAKKNTISWIVSPHAKQRAWERYGVLFSPQKWLDFCNTMQKQKYSFCLGNDGTGNYRFACYYQQRWFLIGCRANGTVGVITTFLPADMLTDTEKIMLRSDEEFRQIDDETWDTNIKMFSASTRKKILADIQISSEELPNDFDQIGKFLEKEIRNGNRHCNR